MSGDHGIMVGHASDETEDGMPFRRLTEVREPAKLCGLGPPPPSLVLEIKASFLAQALTEPCHTV